MTIVSITAQEVSVETLKALFNKADELTKVEFMDCVLPELDENLFDNCKEIIKISITGCGIKCLPAKIFIKTRKLKYLNLSRNDLRSLDENLFKNCISLEYLDLSFNKLQQLDGDLLKACRGLKFLNLSNNLVFNLAKNSFIQCDNLLKINLANNCLKSIDATLFENCYNLVKLDLTNNKIKNLNDDLLRKLEDQRKNGVDFLLFQIPGTQTLLIFKIKKLNNQRNEIKKKHLLHWAILNENFEIIKQFFEDISDLELPIKFLDEKDEIGQTALHLAVKYKNIQTIKLLIDAKVDLNVKDLTNSSILHTAILNDKTCNLHFILSYLSKNLLLERIDLDLKDSDGKTALHLAAQFGDVRAINLLNYYGAAVNMQDKLNKTPLDYAIESPLSEIKKRNCIESLISCGADYKHCYEKVKYLVLDQNTNIIRNLVFEGGGIKGIAYVGALKKALSSEAPLFDFEQIINIGGTSAGAITAVLLALDYKLDEISKILFDLNLADFLDSEHKDEFLRFKEKIKNKNLSFSYLLWHVLKIQKMRQDLDDFHGLFPGETFRKWIDGIISKKLGSNATFRDLQTQIEDGKRFKFLYLVGSNLTTGDYETFSHLDSPDMIIADAVRISMSIPLVWYPHKYYIKDENNKRVVRADKAFYNYVDGGLLFNYPITLFDKKLLCSEGELSVYNYQTLGFRLTSRLNIYNKIHEDQYDDTNGGFFAYIFKIFNLYYNREEITHSKRVKDQDRTIYIDTLGLSALDFDLSKETMNKLIENGKKAVDSHMLLKNKTNSLNNLDISPYLYGCLLKIYAGKINLNQYVKLTSSKLNLNSNLVPSVIYEFYSKGSENEIKNLHDMNLDINKKDENGNNVLHLAALKLDKKCIQRLKEHIKILDVPNRTDDTSISIIKKLNGENDLISFLIEHGAKI